MVFAETNSQYYRVEDFGVEATFVYSATTYSVNGIFENVYSEDLNVNGTVPTFACTESDVALLVVDATITIASSDYIVRVKKPDGTGHTLLVLEKSI